MTDAQVVSVNRGKPVESAATSAATTGIDKRPVYQIEVVAPGRKVDGAGSGVVEDHIGDTKHHGGDQQAVYVVSREELDGWARRLGRSLDNGMFGENVTTRGLDVDAAIIGTVWQVGEDAQLRVCGPRIPCRTFAEHLGEQHWVKRFTQHGRPGAYCAVERPGALSAGDPVQALSVPEHGIDVMTTLRAFTGDLEAADRVLSAGCLHPQEHEELETTVLLRRRR